MTIPPIQINPISAPSPAAAPRPPAAAGDPAGAVLTPGSAGNPADAVLKPGAVGGLAGAAVTPGVADELAGAVLTAGVAGDPAGAVLTSGAIGDPAGPVLTPGAAGDLAGAVLTPGAAGDPADAVLTPGAPPLGSASPAPGSSAGLASLSDWVDIRPLDVAGALQILLAEVRSSLGLSEPMAAAEPAQVPPLVVRAFLRLVPVPAEPVDPAEWSAAAAHAETTLVAALDRALAVVTAWRAVPSTTVLAAAETRALIVAAIADSPDSLNPVWLRPEWVGLAPAMQSYWRRRRKARRGLNDPHRMGGTYDSLDSRDSKDCQDSRAPQGLNDPDVEARASEVARDKADSSGQ